jgi:hypothetical protein
MSNGHAVIRMRRSAALVGGLEGFVPGWSAPIC